MSATPSSESRPPAVKKLKQTRLSFHATMQLGSSVPSTSHCKDNSDQEETHPDARVCMCLGVLHMCLWRARTRSCPVCLMCPVCCYYLKFFTCFAYTILVPPLTKNHSYTYVTMSFLHTMQECITLFHTYTHCTPWCIDHQLLQKMHWDRISCK